MRHFVFDAYGTLFDVHSAAARHRQTIGANWDRLSQLWRTKHLEYTWITAQTGRHTTFWRLAEQSLDYAIAAVGGVPRGVRDELLTAYRTLSAYPEVADVLVALRQRGASLSILTNGDPDMIGNAVASAGLVGLFDALITVHEAGIFKPDRRVYQLVCDRLGVSPAAISFQSSNRWDITGAKVFGFYCVWVNRLGAPDEYPDAPADRIVTNLEPLLATATTARTRSAQVRTIDYYFALNSPWSYLGSARLRQIAQRHRCRVNVKPAKFGEIFVQSGGLPLPKRSPQRRAYRLMELQRWRDHLGIPIVIEPRTFPVDETPAARLVLACVLAGADALALATEFGRSLWELDQVLTEEPVLEAAAKRAEIDLAAVKAKAPPDAELDALWSRNTEEAVARGVFGAPAYVLETGEIFWGQDRLDFLDRALARDPIK